MNLTQEQKDALISEALSMYPDKKHAYLRLRYVTDKVRDMMLEEGDFKTD